MSYASPILSLGQPCDVAVAWVIRQAEAAGLQAVRTFDLKEARQAPHNPAGCPCPHHGTHRCDCQMVVLLIYAENYQPVSWRGPSGRRCSWIDP